MILCNKFLIKKQFLKKANENIFFVNLKFFCNFFVNFYRIISENDF